MCGRAAALPTILILLALASISREAAAAAPDNDDVDGATEVDSVPFSDSVDTTEATSESTDPDCVGGGPTVWYAWTATDDGPMTANTFGSDYDTTLSVWTGTPGAFTNVDCNDDSGGLQSSVYWEATAGVTYYLMAGAFGSGPGGWLEFSLDTASFVPFEITGTIDSATTHLKSATSKVHGTVTCSEDGQYSVFGQVSQTTGRFETVGYIFGGGACAEGENTFVAELQADGALVGKTTYWVNVFGQGYASGMNGSDYSTGTLVIGGSSGK